MKRISLEYLSISAKKIGRIIVWMCRKCIKTKLTIEYRGSTQRLQLLHVLCWMGMVGGFHYFSVGEDHTSDSVVYGCSSQLMLSIFLKYVTK